MHFPVAFLPASPYNLPMDLEATVLDNMRETPTDSFLTSEVALFRPNAIRFSGVVLLFAVSGLAYSFATKDPIDAVAWEPPVGRHHTTDTLPYPLVPKSGRL